MAEKTLKTRIIQKHDTEANWLLATNFTPMNGEIIIYDEDDNHDYKRIKIGNGTDNVNDLKFNVGSWNDLENKPFEFLGEKIYEEFLVRSDDTSTEVYYYDSTYVQSSAGAAIKWKEMVLFINGKYYNVIKDETEWLYYYNGERVLEYDWEYWVHFYPQALGLDDTVPSYEFILYAPGELKQIDEYFIPDTIARVSDISEMAQADWSINDETNPAFVKNRPFYTTDPQEVELLNGTLQFEKPHAYADHYYYNDTNFTILDFKENQEYIVNWDGVEYKCTTFSKDDYIILGNYSLWKNWEENTGEPFCYLSDLYLFTKDDASEHNVILKTIKTLDITIPQKYLGVSIKSGVGNYSVVLEDIERNEASGQYSHAEGYITTASGWYSHAEGRCNDATGDCSHAEGDSNTASGSSSHAEGQTSTASGNYSHVEGISNTASGEASHAEGNWTQASGYSSHAEGRNTIASGEYQHVQGKNNIEDNENKYAHIVGNGSWDEHSNAHTLDWDGNAWYAGDVYVGGTSQDDTTAKKLATEDYVNTKVSDLVNSAPETLDTLGELATALEQNSDIVETLNASIGNKADKADIVQSDWLVNDESNLTFIKNRPFYEEGSVILVDTVSPSQFNGSTMTLVSANYIWQAGDEMIVSLNGKTYKLIGTASGTNVMFNEPNVISISYMKMGTVNSYMINLIETLTTSIEISYNGETVHKLDEKFIPDTIARVKDIVTPVQPNWAENDETSLNYVQNRTHYDGRYDEYIINKETVTIIYDEFIANKKWSIDYSKIKTETGYSLEPGKTYTVTIADLHGTEYKYDILCGTTGDTTQSPILNYSDDDIVIEIGDSLTSISLHASFNAIYNVGDEYERNGVFSISYIEGEIVKLDPKFLPDNIGGTQSDWLVNDESNPAYVKNRPFYTTEPEEIVIFEEQTIEGFEQWEESVYAIENIELSKEFILGQAYTVIWDGTTYENLVSFNNDIYITIGAAYGDYSTYPFGIDMMYTPVGATICLHTNSPNISHTLSISTIQSTHIKIDEKYLPDSVFEKVGKSTTGTVYNIDGEEVVAEWGAEIFNNYENNIATGEYSHAEGSETTASGWWSHAEGYNTVASKDSSHAEGCYTIASGDSSHAEGLSTKAFGEYSHAEGSNTTASGQYSHSEGYKTKATGWHSHAEGNMTTASGKSAHTEGNYTTASGQSSHAEGETTTASGSIAHAEGYKTIASSKYQHVQGKYNIEDTEDRYAHIVGNGNEISGRTIRSNAHTLDWDGNAWFAGDVTATDAEGNSVSILSLLTEINNLKAELATLKATYAELTETDANALVEEVFN